MTHGALLTGEGLALVRGGRLLFEGLDLSLGAGDGVRVSGPNGSGKTSLIRVLAGLLAPTAGAIRHDGVALADDRPALDRELPLRKALEFWRGGRLGEAIDAFVLAPLSEVPVRFLSAGQLKRASLARLMASEAPVWLLDEPHNALDADGLERLAAAIAAHRSKGGAAVVASHSALAGEWRTLALGQDARQ